MDAHARSIAQVNQFINADLPLNAWALPIIVLLYILYPLPFLPLIAVLVVGNMVVLVLAQRALRRGHLEASVTMMCLSLAVICLFLMFFAPELFPMVAVLMVLPVALALPHLGRRSLLRLMLAATAIALIVSALSLRVDPFGVLAVVPSQVVRLINVGLVPVIGGLVFFVLWQYSGRLDETLAQVQSYNAALRESERALARRVDDLSALGGQVAASAAAITTASVHLARAAHQAEGATAQIASSTQHLADGAQQQSDGVSRTAHSIDEMSHAIDELADGARAQAGAVGTSAEVTQRITTAIAQVAAHAQASSVAAREATLAAEAGARSVDDAIETMGQVAEAVRISARRVADMGSASRQIGDIAATISDLADRTTLLALNAAIEAARAGQQGRGFAVVATEVKRLAERAGVATREVAQLVQGIEAAVDQAEAASSNAESEVEASVSHAAVLRETLASSLVAAQLASRRAEEISDAAREISGAADDLTEAMRVVSEIVDRNTAGAERMAAASAEVSRSVENIANVSDDTSAAADELSAAAEEVNAEAQGVARLAQSLSEMAQGLQELATQFGAGPRPALQMTGASAGGGAVVGDGKPDVWSPAQRASNSSPAGTSAG